MTKLKKSGNITNETPAALLEEAAKPFNIERGFISKLLEIKDMKLLKEKNIKSVFFTGDNKRVFKYILKTFRETGEVPTYRIVLQKFPNYRFETHLVDGCNTFGTDEPLLYWCTELRNKAKHNKMADIIEEVAEILERGETEKAYASFKKGVWYIEGNIVESKGIDITKDTEDRKTAYIERKKNKGMMGIPTGISHLDYLLKGLVKGTLTTLIAKTGVGKTWFLILIACHAMLQGYKVVIFVREMNTEIMQDRCEAMLFGMLCGSFDYNKFKSGTLDKDQETAYFDFLDNILPNLEPLRIEDVSGVSSVVSVIEQEKPDIVYIDGAYLMEDEQGAKDDWLRVTHITRDLKQIAKNSDIPVFINTQADQNTTSKAGPGLSDIKYSQAIGQDSDNIMALYRDDVMINDDEMGIRMLKQREGLLGKTVINWDFKNMSFNSIYSEAENGDSLDDDNVDEGQDGVFSV